MKLSSDEPEALIPTLWWRSGACHAFGEPCENPTLLHRAPADRSVAAAGTLRIPFTQACSRVQTTSMALVRITSALLAPNNEPVTSIILRHCFSTGPARSNTPYSQLCRPSEEPLRRCCFPFKLPLPSITCRTVSEMDARSQPGGCGTSDLASVTQVVWSAQTKLHLGKGFGRRSVEHCRL